MLSRGENYFLQRSKELRSSKKFFEFLNFVRKFRSYKPYNNMLVYLQNPNITFYASATDWEKKFHRKVKEEALPMIILVPFAPIMLVYDLIDTEGPPLPDYLVDPFAVEGPNIDSILHATLDNLREDGIVVKRKPASFLHAGTATRYINKKKTQKDIENIKLEIMINEELDNGSAYATLCHELAHIYLGHLGTDEDHWWPDRRLTKSQVELEAEATSYLVCGRAGLTTKSAEYLSTYLTNEDDLNYISRTLIVKTAGYIETLGSKKPKKKDET